MELSPILEYLTSLGLAPTEIITIALLWRLNQRQHCLDRRIAVAEVQLKRRHDD